MIPSPEDLETLATFEADEQPALSVYLNLTTAKRRESAIDDFEVLVNRQLDACGADLHFRKMLQEDIDIVRMYLDNGCLPCSIGVAIFSCASCLFWRAYPLPVAMADRVDIGPAFNLTPLMKAIREIERRRELLAEAA